MLLFSFCDFPWWLPWLLLPLAALLGWWLRGGTINKLNARIEELEANLKACRARLSGLEGDLSDCHAKRASLDSDLTLLRGRLKEGGINVKGLSDVDLSSSSTVAATAKSSGSRSGVSSNKFAALKEDNLQVIEGIGPKMNDVLRKHGIKTWTELAASTPEGLRAILDKENPTRYRIIDPKTWPKQAGMAASGDWDGLISYQKDLDTGRTDTTGGTDSKVEKLMVKMGILKRWKQDDLKAIEGIGPKIEKLLKDGGIKTWRDMANSKVSKIQSILDAAGPRYKLADPGTWSKQADMAADGRWDDLSEYQDFLQGGK